MEPFAVCPGGGNDPEASWVARMYRVASRLFIDLFTVSVSLIREITSGRKSSSFRGNLNGTAFGA